MTPDLALYYCFFSAAGEQQGSGAALKHLVSLGCTLATKAWVDNHWGLILWKLAGMVCLDPEREAEPEKKRWCWEEIIRQLLYRYERELNAGSRPPLRLITTQDAPVTSPMVLVISKITWSEEARDESGVPVPPHPELEVSDGWYRLRAKADESLARAARRGALTVGRKVFVSGARVSRVSSTDVAPLIHFATDGVRKERAV